MANPGGFRIEIDAAKSGGVYAGHSRQRLNFE